MSAIIYEKETNGLYPTGQRTVSTFPSGLIRVDQTFVCKTTAAETHRAALSVGTNMPGGSYPAIDGLKIFPDPQEVRYDDGFTNFLVSAYGRTKNKASITHKTRTFKAWDGFEYGFSVYETTGKICLPKGASFNYNSLNLNDIYRKPFAPFNYNLLFNGKGITENNVFQRKEIDNNGRMYQRTVTEYRLHIGVASVSGQNIPTPKYSYFIIADPIIDIKTKTDYGSFEEIEFVAIPEVNNPSFTPIISTI